MAVARRKISRTTRKTTSTNSSVAARRKTTVRKPAPIGEDRLLRTLQQPIVVAGQPCTVAASVGLAIYPDHGKDAAALLRRAVAQAGGPAVSGGAAALSAIGRGSAANDPAS